MKLFPNRKLLLLFRFHDNLLRKVLADSDTTPVVKSWLNINNRISMIIRKDRDFVEHIMLQYYRPGRGIGNFQL